MIIEARNLSHKELNEQIRAAKEGEKIIINGCLAQRFIASGMSGKDIVINGVPGNALGAYMNGSRVEVFGNVQDAVGDTMNSGTIIIRGNAGDTLGYAMRGGRIFVQGNTGYRTGIHMKQYKDCSPTIIVGGRTGSFMGEYLAGGTIIVLGLNGETPLTGFMFGSGMHGGRIYFRTENMPECYDDNITARKAEPADMAAIESSLRDYCKEFSLDYKTVADAVFYVIDTGTVNPYKRMYVKN
jgi:glutamate synthase domain-containing protein 3